LSSPPPASASSTPANPAVKHSPGSKEEKLKRIMNAFAKLQHELQEEKRVRIATERLLQHGVGSSGTDSPSDSFHLAKDLASAQQDLIDKSTKLQEATSQKAELATKLDSTERNRKMLDDENKKNGDDLRSVSTKHQALQRRFQEYTQALQRAEEENSSLNERMDALRAVNHRLVSAENGLEVLYIVAHKVLGHSNFFCSRFAVSAVALRPIIYYYFFIRTLIVCVLSI
jgi:chromosome segregation ATPase